MSCGFVRRVPVRDASLGYLSEAPAVVFVSPSLRRTSERKPRAPPRADAALRTLPNERMMPRRVRSVGDARTHAAARSRPPSCSEASARRPSNDSLVAHDDSSFGSEGTRPISTRNRSALSSPSAASVPSMYRRSNSISSAVGAHACSREMSSAVITFSSIRATAAATSDGPATDRKRASAMFTWFDRLRSRSCTLPPPAAAAPAAPLTDDFRGAADAPPPPLALGAAFTSKRVRSSASRSSCIRPAPARRSASSHTDCPSFVAATFVQCTIRS